MYLNVQGSGTGAEIPWAETGTCGQAQRVARYICTTKQDSGTSQKHDRNATQTNTGTCT